jgi:hypothetical protein
MNRDSLLLNLFRAALTGDHLGLHAFCDALEENAHPLAPFAREVARATADVPSDLEAVYEPAFLARGTNWRIEYRPGRRARRIHPDLPLMQGGQNAEVGEVYEGDGPWTELDGVATKLALGGARNMPTTLSSPQEKVTPQWVRLAFDAVRLNMIGHLLVGHQVAMVLPGQDIIEPVIPAIDHRIKWLRDQGL